MKIRGMGGVVFFCLLAASFVKAGEPIGVVPKGFFDDDIQKEKTADSLNAEESNHAKNGFRAELTISQINKDGALCHVVLLSTQYSTDYTQNSSHGYQTEVNGHTDSERLDQLVWVTDLPNASSIVDGDVIRTTIWVTGTYTYTTVTGAEKRVRKFTADPEVGRQLYEKMVMDGTLSGASGNQ